MPAGGGSFIAIRSPRLLVPARGRHAAFRAGQPPEQRGGDAFADANRFPDLTVLAAAASHASVPFRPCRASQKFRPETVRADFNDLLAVVHYTRAAHELGLWASERVLIERFFPDRNAPLLEAGCGAGRVTLGLWEMGYRRLTAFDFAEELVDQARSLAAERHADGPGGITFLRCTRLKDTLPALRNCLVSSNG